MLPLVNIITFMWILFWTIFSMQRLSNGIKESIDLIMPVFLIFCGLPLLLDVVVRQPYYSMQPGFAVASADHMTGYIYCVYVALIPVLWRIMSTLFREKTHNSINEPNYLISINNISQFSRRPLALIALFALLIVPIFVALRSPDYIQYLTYSTILRYSLYDKFDEWHSYVALFTMISVLSGTYLILIGKNRILSLSNCISIYPLILIASWLNGKRAILALAIVLIIAAGWFKNEFKGRKLFIASVVGLLVIIVFSFSYQGITGRIEDRNWYDNIRIDFGRDDIIKMAIYAELNPQQMQILEYRGQSCLFYATMVVPREIWPEKPLPYAQYATSAMLFTEPREWGWGMTTSIFDEAIANTGWYGFLIGPLIIILVCLIGDRSASPLVRLLTPLIGSLLLVVQMVAFAPIFVIWAGAQVLSVVRFRKN